MATTPAVLDAYSVAARTWHSHKELGWIGGEVTSKNIDRETVVLEFKDESDKVSSVKAWPLAQETRRFLVG